MPICYDHFDSIASDSDVEPDPPAAIPRPVPKVEQASEFTDDQLCNAAWLGDIPTLMRAGSARCLQFNTRRGKGLLHLAILGDRPPCVTFLLCAYDLDPNAKNVDGRTPLFVASASSNAKMVDVLLTHRADPNIPSEEQAVRPLHAAANVSVARRLVEGKANPMAKASFHTTPLHTALRHASDSTVEFLISVMPPEGLSAPSDTDSYFGFAVRRQCPLANIHELLNALCQRKLVTGADLHAAVSNGYTSLLRPLVLELGDANVRDSDGFTPLHAVCLGSPNALGSLKELVRCGADVNARTPEGYTPVLYSLWRPSLVKFLLRKGADARFVAGVTDDMVDHLKTGLTTKHNQRAAANIQRMVLYIQKRICPACGAFSYRFCTGCRRVYYCNTACQGKDFQDHRELCELPQ